MPSSIASDESWISTSVDGEDDQKIALIELHKEFLGEQFVLILACLHEERAQARAKNRPNDQHGLRLCLALIACRNRAVNRNVAARLCYEDARRRILDGELVPVPEFVEPDVIDLVDDDVENGETLDLATDDNIIDLTGDDSDEDVIDRTSEE